MRKMIRESAGGLRFHKIVREGFQKLCLLSTCFGFDSLLGRHGSEHGTFHPRGTGGTNVHFTSFRLIDGRL